jgi:histidinol phosphatase-like PHP family hydrolase
MSVHNAEVEISRQQGRGRRLLLDEATTLRDTLLLWLRAQPGCTDAAAVGNPGGRQERFDAIELLAAAESPAAVGAAFAASPEVAAVVRSRGGRTTVLTGDGARVTLHAVAPGRFAAARRRLTGADDLDGAPSDLVTVGHIRGDLHSHTTASDGRNTIEEMARGAMARGYGYLAITEHTPAVNVLERGIGLDVGRLREHVAAIREVAGRLAGEGFTLLAGTEVDILPDGSLDYPDDVLAELDWVVASPHVALRQSGARATARMVAAASHPLVDVIGHPTGRHLIHRRPMAVDMAALIATCAEHGTFLEINSNPERLDLSAANARAAREAGVRMVIDTDAHEVATLANIRYGVTVARRAWATPADVVNTRSWADVQQLRKPARRG